MVLLIKRIVGFEELKHMWSLVMGVNWIWQGVAHDASMRFKFITKDRRENIK